MHGTHTPLSSRFCFKIESRQRSTHTNQSMFTQIYNLVTKF